MRTTITTEMDLGDNLRIEVDGDYWRYEDETVQDLTLCRLWVYEPDETGQEYATDLLHGLDKSARLCVERNLFKLTSLTKRLCEDIATQGDDMHLEPQQDPQDY